MYTIFTDYSSGYSEAHPSKDCHKRIVPHTKRIGSKVELHSTHMNNICILYIT